MHVCPLVPPYTHPRLAGPVCVGRDYNPGCKRRIWKGDKEERGDGGKERGRGKNQGCCIVAVPPTRTMVGFIQFSSWRRCRGNSRGRLIHSDGYLSRPGGPEPRKTRGEGAKFPGREKIVPWQRPQQRGGRTRRRECEENQFLARTGLRDEGESKLQESLFTQKDSIFPPPKGM